MLVIFFLVAWWLIPLILFKFTRLYATYPTGSSIDIDFRVKLIRSLSYLITLTLLVIDLAYIWISWYILSIAYILPHLVLLILGFIVWLIYYRSLNTDCKKASEIYQF
jgi:hypothetical protein